MVVPADSFARGGRSGVRRLSPPHEYCNLSGDARDRRGRHAAPDRSRAHGAGEDGCVRGAPLWRWSHAREARPELADGWLPAAGRRARADAHSVEQVQLAHSTRRPG
eukprot:scaffold13772_cov79-Phaeocystis_antarctica.AAC.2